MYEDLTPDDIREEILTKISNLDTREGSFVSDLTAPVANAIYNLYMAMNALIPIAFVDATSGEYIDRRAGEYGIVRKEGVKARAILQFTGEDGTSVPTGSVFTTNTGLEFVTLEDARIADGTAQASSEAAEPGAQYNVEDGSITEQYQVIEGLTSVTNEAATGGIDQETDEALMERLNLLRRRPATSGNAYHYIMWALEVDGVGGAKVTPLENGPGTVGILIAGPDKEPVSSEIVESTLAHIEQERPIGALVTVESAQPIAVNISASVKLNGLVELSTVKEILIQKMQPFLSNLTKIYFEDPELKVYEVPINAVGAILIGIEGVLDYNTLKINGEITNLIIEKKQVPVLGTVNLT